MSQIASITKREWASYFNSPVAYVFIVIFLMLSGFFTFGISRFYEAGQAELRSFFFWHPWLYLILVPAVTMRLWSEERKSNTIEILLTLPITAGQAIVGKFLAAWAFLCLSLLLTLPVVITADYLGDPDMGLAITGYVGSALLAGAYIALGMLTSALTKNQVISFIIAVVLGLFMILAGFPPVTDLLGRFLPEVAVDAVAAFSFMQHYETLQRGILDLRDLVYFASVIGVSLLATHIVLKEKAAS